MSTGTFHERGGGGRSRRRGEAGFTLIELLIVIGIVAILIVASFVALSGGKRSAKARAMTVVAADVGKAVATYNRMNPPINTDRLVAGSTWTSTQTEAAGGLYATTGERLLDPWPTDPYTGDPVTIRRGATCPTTAPVGTIAVCRVAGANRTTFRVRAWARNQSNASYVVYDQLM